MGQDGGNTKCTEGATINNYDSKSAINIDWDKTWNNTVFIRGKNKNYGTIKKKNDRKHIIV